MNNIFIVENEDMIEIYNEGILIIKGKGINEIKDLMKILLEGNNDIWEVELLNNILYTLDNNLSTLEVA